MSEYLVIRSSRHDYAVKTCENLDLEFTSDDFRFIVDARVLDLYKERFSFLNRSENLIVIEAHESNKSIEKIPEYVNKLVHLKTRRAHKLVGVGGGVIQDITCFLASIFLRGVDWVFIPTTLLAQCDSCIGSKSSINSNTAKNILGTFYPPRHIYLNSSMIVTLGKLEILSGIGEMLKVHAISSFEDFNGIANDYDEMLINRDVLYKYVWKSLTIKKSIIEIDEFDANIRNVMNYGHSFGHAIESATHYKIPHGIAVSMGCDLANYFAMKSGLGSEVFFEKAHITFFKNYSFFANEDIPLDIFISAISKDKKNTQSKLRLVLPSKKNKIEIFEVFNDGIFQSICQAFFRDVKPNG